MWQSTKPGTTAHPEASTTTPAVSSGSKPANQAGLDGKRAALEHELAGAVVAQVGEPVAGWAQGLGASRTGGQ